MVPAVTPATGPPFERLRAFFDADAIVPLSPPAGFSVTSARGEVDGASTIAFATDPSRKGGTLDPEGCAVIVAAINSAVQERVPVVGLWHSAGACLQRGVAALDAVGRVFMAIVRASGRVPQISVVLGPAAGGAAYGAALTDVVIMSENGRIFVTGPGVIRTVTGEEVDMERLGGPEAHARRSGVAHLTAPTEAAALTAARQVAALLGRQGTMSPEIGDGTDLARLLPERPARAYDVRPLVHELLDWPGLELQPRWAPNIMTALGRFAGRTIGVVANNPLHLAGCLDSAAAEKAARFVRMCDSFGVPLIVLVDVPGYLPGVSQEWNGVVRRGAKLLHAFAEAAVPRVSVVTRKAYGGAYIAMNSRVLGATAVYAWPGAEIAVMGAAAAVNVLHRRTLAAVPPHERALLHARLVDAEVQAAGGVQNALNIGAVDAVIEPAETRKRIAAALAAAQVTRGRHANIPL